MIIVTTGDVIEDVAVVLPIRLPSNDCTRKLSASPKATELKRRYLNVYNFDITV